MSPKIFRHFYERANDGHARAVVRCDHCNEVINPGDKIEVVIFDTFPRSFVEFHYRCWKKKIVLQNRIIN